MRFPQTAEYALRAMTQIAVKHASGGPTRAQDLADETRIPMAYLSKVLRKLVVAGLLTSQKGHRGGFLLARSPAAITFREVLDAVDFSGAEGCVFGWGECDNDHPCPLHPAWSKLKQAFEDWADRTTLAAADMPPHGSAVPGGLHQPRQRPPIPPRK